MAAVSIAGIFRAGIFSPNHVGNDAAILNRVAAMLRRRGLTVNLYSEDQFIALGIGSEPVVINMCRDVRSLSRLHQLEEQGRVVINSGYGIRQCVRENMVRRLEAAGIPQPLSLVVATDENVRSRLESLEIGLCWIKRGDSPTIHKEDISRVRHAQEAQELLGEYFIRGIRSAVISRHAEGLALKFYGVAGTDFFHHFFPMGGQPPLDPDELRRVCTHAAQVLGVTVYGGDAIVNPADGSFVIISFNDWPSFAPCREEAAKGIVKLVSSHARKLMK